MLKDLNKVKELLSKPATIDSIAQLYDVFFTNHVEVYSKVAQKCIEYLNGKRAKFKSLHSTFVRYCYRFNFDPIYTKSNVPANNLKWSLFNIRLKSRLTMQEYYHVLLVGTFHYSGYCREYCIRTLSSLTEYNTMPYYLIALNDSVNSVQDIAYKSVIANLTTENIIDNLSAIYSLSRKGRIKSQNYLKLNSIIEEKLLSEVLPTNTILKLPENARKYVYLTYIKNNTFSLQDVLILLSRDRSRSNIYLLNSLLNKGISPEVEDLLLTSKDPRVRYKIMQYRYNRLNNIWQGIQSLLTDSSKTIREYARYIVQKHSSIDVREYYISLLENGKIDSNILCGLAEVSIAKDTETFLKYIDSESLSIRKSALYGISKSSNVNDHSKLMYSSLVDTSKGLSKLAYSIILAHGMDNIDYNRYYSKLISTNELVLKRRIAKLIVNSNDLNWIRMAYIFKLASVPEVQDIAYMGIASIIGTQKYLTCPKDDAEYIKYCYMENIVNIYHTLEQYKPTIHRVNKKTLISKLEFTLKSYNIVQEGNKKYVALTFDDGINTTTSKDVLNKLIQYNVVASYFICGNQIDSDSKKILQLAHSKGCEIDNHSYSHSCMTELSKEEILKEVEDTSSIIEEAIHVRPKYFRPPYIAINDTMYNTIDMTFIQGICPEDYLETVSVEERFSRIVSELTDGTIILLHDMKGNTKTVQTLDLLIPYLLNNGYQLVTVSELFKIKGVVPKPHQKIVYTVVK